MDLLTVKSAALLLDVHDSTVKRLCNTGELPCSQTEGGHRRIRVEDVFAYANREGRDIDVVEFGADAVTVWEGAQQFQETGSDAILVELLVRWLRQFRTEAVLSLIAFLERSGVSLAEILDGPIASTFRETGRLWAEGSLDVGSEHRISECFTDALYALIYEATRRVPFNAQGVALVACSATESHALGALMVRLLLLHEGWRVVYLGRNTPSDEIARHQQSEGAYLVCISMSERRLGPEISSLVAELSARYDPDTPYRLAIGGAALKDFSFTYAGESPFDDLAFFTSTRDFIRRLPDAAAPTEIALAHDC
jgi:excisionase family DNA binding protein